MLTIKAEAMAGDDIKDVSREAIDLAKRIGCRVEFGFNGVTCFASGDGCPVKLADKALEMMGSSQKYKMVSV